MDQTMNTVCKLKLFVLAWIFLSISWGQAIVQPTDRAISLTGVVRIVHGYGAPGYGEDKKVDARISYFALDLPFKVTVACTPSREDLADIECGATNRVRLFFPVQPAGIDLESRARKLVGRRVVVTGALRRRTSMYQITPVYLNVADVALPNEHRE